MCPWPDHTLPCLLLPSLQPSHHLLCPFPIHTQTHQRAISVDHCPVSRLPVAFNAHGVRPPIPVLRGWGGQGVAYPTLLLLLPFAPGTISRLVAVPRATILGEPLERYLVHMAEWAVVMRWLHGALGRWLRWWLCNGILL